MGTSLPTVSARATRVVARVLGGTAALSLCAGVASAHQLGVEQFEAPLPLGALYAGAGATVAATAGWLALADRTGTEGATAASGDRATLRISGGLARTLTRTLRVGFLLLVAAAVAHGLFGPQVRAENLATVLVWSVWLKGVALVAAVAGSPWRILSPWRTIYEGLVRLEGREIAVLGPYPERLGSWPALAGFLLWVGVAGNLTVAPRDPAVTAGLVAAYAFVVVAGALAYGEAFLERGDAFAVFYRLFGRVAPLSVTAADGASVDGARSIDSSATAAAGSGRGDLLVSLRAPWRGCTLPARDGAVAAFVVAAVYTVSFDGFTATPEYQQVLFAARDLAGLGASTGVALYLAGLLLFLAAFGVVVRLSIHRELSDRATTDGGSSPKSDGGGDSTPDGGSAWTTLPERRRAVATASLAFAPTVVPIAVAYEVAHTYPFVLSEAGRLVGLLGALTGVGVHLAPLAWLSVPAFWASQVVLIVGGHVVAVVAAHAVAARRTDSRRDLLATHAPLTALMAGYTVLSLWIVSRPVVA